jgi:hypothetical protein
VSPGTFSGQAIPHRCCAARLSEATRRILYAPKAAQLAARTLHLLAGVRSVVVLGCVLLDVSELPAQSGAEQHRLAPLLMLMGAGSPIARW